MDFDEEIRLVNEFSTEFHHDGLSEAELRILEKEFENEYNYMEEIKQMTGQKRTRKVSRSSSTSASRIIAVTLDWRGSQDISDKNRHTEQNPKKTDAVIKTTK